MINIDHLTEDELVDLNHRIVERLRFFRQARAHQAMLQFKIGERVCFRTDSGELVTGTLTQYNRKTVSIVTDAGHRWNVSPALLQRLQEHGAAAQAPNLSILPR